MRMYSSKETILEVRELTKTFQKGNRKKTAVESVSFDLRQGECLGLVGESGCGKSTTARMITHLTKADRGSVCLEGQETLFLRGRKERAFYQKVQMVFQSPQDSFDPRRTLGDGIRESLKNHGVSRREAQERMAELLERMELEPEIAGCYPHEVSGGQCQRAAIARALAIRPRLIICDEATSALDVTVQAQIVQLLKQLRKEGMSLLFISHDLALVQHLCDRVLVMHQGRIIEQGETDAVIRHPGEAYTRKLIDSAL